MRDLSDEHTGLFPLPPGRDDRSNSAGLMALISTAVSMVGLEQQLQAVFADGGAKAADLRGVARQPRLVVLHAAEELEHHVLAPALHQSSSSLRLKLR